MKVTLFPLIISELSAQRAQIQIKQTAANGSNILEQTLLAPPLKHPHKFTLFNLITVCNRIFFVYYLLSLVKKSYGSSIHSIILLDTNEVFQKRWHHISRNLQFQSTNRL